MEAPRVRLGELLVKSGLLTQEQLDEALVMQQQDGRRLGTILVELGLVSETQVTQILSQQLSIPWVSLHHIDFSRQLLNLVPREIVERYCLVPIYVRRVRHIGDSLYVAMDDPTNETALRDVAKHSGLHVRAMIAPPSDIRAAIRVYYGVEEDEADTGVHSRREVEQLLAEEAASAPDISTVREAEPKARPPQESGIDFAQSRESMTSIAEETTPARVMVADIPAAEKKPAREPDVEAPPSSSSDLTAPLSPRAPGMPKPKHGKGAKIVSLTLLDGTRINLPARPGLVSKHAAPPQEQAATASDLIAALKAVTGGADATQVLDDNVRWESMFAALLSLLLRKHVIADWEFIEELKKG